MLSKSYKNVSTPNTKNIIFLTALGYYDNDNLISCALKISTCGLEHF